MAWANFKYPTHELWTNFLAHELEFHGQVSWPMNSTS